MMKITSILLLCILFFIIIGNTIYTCKRSPVREGFFKKLRRKIKKAFRKPKPPKNVTAKEYSMLKDQTNKLKGVLNDIIDESEKDNKLKGDLIKVKSQSDKFLNAINGEAGGKDLLKTTQNI